MTSASPVAIERVDELDPDVEAEMSALLARTEVHEGHSPIGEHKLVRPIAGQGDAFALLARLDRALVGYARASRFTARQRLPSRVASELLVDRVHRGRGIGRALLDRLAREALRLRVERLDAWVHHPGPAAIGLAAAFGMRPTRHLWQMGTALDTVASRHPSPPGLEGIRVRGYGPADGEALAAVVRDAFPEHPENADFAPADIDALSRLDWFDPATILLAEEAGSGRLIGVHWVKVDPGRDSGEVYLLAVTRAMRGRGLGSALLLIGLVEMRRRGLRLAYLYVDSDNEAAIELYQRTGFRHEHVDTCYSLDLR
jgi:mycothiol synthase